MAKSSWLAGILIAGIALSGCGSDENDAATTPVQGNSPPTISGSPMPEVEAGLAYSFTPEASDNETPGDSLIFSIANKPEWATFSAKTGSISGTPTESQVADYDKISISVSDGSLTTSMSSFKIRVKPRPNRVPNISGLPATSVTAGMAYVFRPSASDPDGNVLTFSISNKPAWASFSSTTGQLSGTPDSSHVGTVSNIVIAVSDGTASSALPAFSITVMLSNRAPVISGTPGTSVVAGNAWSFAPTASDPDGDGLTFSITGKPAWASFNTSNGVLSGTPGSTAVGTYAGIVITASDSRGGSASLPAFTVTVSAPPNRAPLISGSAQTSVVAGSNYSFAPAGSDPDGDALSYSISGKPAWASFSTATGALSGSPASTSVGTYTGIVITVTDARGASASLPAFSIAVTAPAPSGTAQLSWLPPVQYSDGSQLPTADLAGYRVYHGTSPTALNDIITLDGAANTAYTMNQLVAGTHYFAVSAVTMYGAESALSEVRSKTIQ